MVPSSLPRSEGKDFTISVKLPEGTRLERTDAVVSNLEFLLPLRE
ncbi:MAG: hypothetical protein ACOX19_03335 [Fermentimonas sp.]